nr:MAG TPA: hypothetical protein [Caudoviricetes sp.]
MNKKFFIHQITVYHFKDDESVSKIHFKQVYFRHTKKINQVDKGVQTASTGTIYIPTNENIDIKTDDYIIEGVINEEFDFNSLMRKYQIFKVVSVDDNRKGNLQHFKIGVAE